MRKGIYNCRLFLFKKRLSERTVFEFEFVLYNSETRKTSIQTTFIQQVLQSLNRSFLITISRTNSDFTIASVTTQSDQRFVLLFSLLFFSHIYKLPSDGYMAARSKNTFSTLYNSPVEGRYRQLKVSIRHNRHTRPCARGSNGVRTVSIHR
jgi:hypothetical protein